MGAIPGKMTEPSTAIPSNTAYAGAGHAAHTSALSALVPAEIPQADVVISGADCSINTKRLEDVIRGRARSLMGSALKQAYEGALPVHTGALLDFTVSKMVTKENICHALRTPFASSGEDRDALIKKYKNNGLTKHEASGRGIVSERFKLKTDCAINIDYEKSGHYSGVENCGDVTDELGDNPVPVTMAVLPFESGAVCNLFADPQFQTEYKNYPDRDLATCSSSNDEHTDTYNNISGGPLGTNIEFGLRGFNGQNWAATRMITSCTERGRGEKHDSLDDMKFIFSARACVPLDVVIYGERHQYTLYLDQATAAPNTAGFNFMAFFAATTTYDKSFEYVLGGMLAKFLAAEKSLK